MKISDSDISDVANFIKNISHIIQSVPYLGTVLQICNTIVQVVQGVEANRKAMKRLCEYATLFAKSLAEHACNNTNFSNSLKSNIEAVNALFGDINIFVGQEAEKSFLKQAMEQAKTANKIKQFSTQISQLAQSLQVAVSFDLNSLILAVQQDTQQLVDMMRDIQHNNEAMNAKMDEMLNDAKLQNQKLETLESIAETIHSDMLSLPEQIRDVMQKMLEMAQERIEKSAGRKLSPRFDWTISQDDVNIDLSAKIGEGGFGTIYRATWDGRQVVVKIIDKTHVNQQAAENIEKEASIWYPLRHPNIIPLWGVCLNVEKPFLVMPTMKCDLSTYISTHPDIRMQNRIKIITSIASGMKYLHSREFPIIHGDIKANNVLVGFDGEICITDFGLAFIKTLSNSNTKRHTGAARWVASEKYKRGYKLSPPSDVFAFAMTCIEIITGLPPFPEEHQDVIVTDWIKEGERPNRPENVPDQLWSLIQDCWHQDPSLRPNFSQIVNRLKNPINFPVQPDSNAVFVESKPSQSSEPHDSKYTLNGSDGHLMPTKIPKNITIRRPSQIPNVEPKQNIGNNVSLDDHLVQYKISEATRLRVGRGEADACIKAIKIISKGKPISDACWNVVIQLYKKAAESDNLEAYFELAWMYFAGVGVEKNELEAFDYLQCVVDKSVDVTHKTISTYMVGVCYYLGVGTEKDMEKGWKLINESKSDEFVLGGQWAFDWVWGKPIDKIHSSSHVSTVFFEHVNFGSESSILLKHLEAVCYFYGFGTSKDQKKAVEMFTSLADCGFAVSEVMLGSCYYDGYVVEKNYEKAFEWFKQASDQEYVWGQANLGSCYRAEKGVPQDFDKAVELFRKAADQGNADAQAALGACYRDGQGVPQDYETALEWFQKAADRGDAATQCILGGCYRDGECVTQDYVKAFEWFHKAADQGNAVAQCELGRCYRDGEGVPQDFKKAVEWYRKAADRGDTEAQFWLGECYRNGEGVTVDREEAIKWLTKAADQGHADAKQELQKLTKNTFSLFRFK